MTDRKREERLTVHTFAREDQLQASVSGEFTLAGAQSTFLEILGAVRVSRSSRVLVDGRQVTGEPSTIERFFYGDFVANEVRKIRRRSGLMFAYVLHEPVLDPMGLGAAVALNRGVTVKVFDDYQIAKAWLLHGA